MMSQPAFANRFCCALPSSVQILNNSADMRRLSADFTRLRTEVDDLRQTVARLPADSLGGESAARLEMALTAMLVWIGLQGLAALFGGLAILLLPLARPRA